MKNKVGPVAPLLAMTFSFLTGCVSLPPEGVSPSSAPSLTGAPNVAFPVRIAVLPVFNRGVSTDGSIIVRAFAVRKLDRDLGYFVQKTDETDEILRSRSLGGTTDPFQDPLTKADPAVLASWLAVDGLLHGELLNYSKSSAEIYHQVQVHVRYWFTDASGKTIWEGQKDLSGGGFATGFVSLDAVLADGSLSPDVQDRVRRSELSELALQAVDAALSTFPRRR